MVPAITECTYVILLIIDRWLHCCASGVTSVVTNSVHLYLQGRADLIYAMSPYFTALCKMGTHTHTHTRLNVTKHTVA